MCYSCRNSGHAAGAEVRGHIPRWSSGNAKRLIFFTGAGNGREYFCPNRVLSLGAPPMFQSWTAFSILFLQSKETTRNVFISNALRI